MIDDINPALVDGQPAPTPVCGHCGNERIVRDACARWDPRSGQWQLGELFDRYFCDVCERDTTPCRPADEAIADPLEP